ncbi:MAG: hypothetical protein C4288_02540 [Leptolyngbya sp. ERB_1_1]
MSLPDKAQVPMFKKSDLFPVQFLLLMRLILLIETPLMTNWMLSKYTLRQFSFNRISGRLDGH